MEDVVNYFLLLTKFQFATEGYVLMAYLEMCAVKTLKEVPESFPGNGNPAQQMAWLNRLSRRILPFLADKREDMVMCVSPSCDKTWFHYSCIGLDGAPDPDDDVFCSDACRQSGDYIYCYCQRRNQQLVMVQCAREDTCLRYEWYHHACLDVKEEHIPG